MSQILHDLPEELKQNIDTYRSHLSRFIEENYIITITDYDGFIKYANDQFCQLSGFSTEELIGTNQRIVSSKQHSNEFWDQMWATIKSGQSWRGNVCNKKKNGELYWVKTSIIPIQDENGKIVEFMSFRKDITLEQINLKELEKSNMFLDQAQRLSKVGYWELFPETGELYWDSVVKEIHEVPQDFVPNVEDAINFYDGEAKNIIQSIVNDAFTTGKDWDIQLPFITAKGNKLWVRAIGKVVLNEYGKPERIYGVFRDETDERNTQKEFYDQQVIRSEIEMKEKLFTQMSNKVRNPLNAIMGLTAALENVIDKTDTNTLSILEALKNSQDDLLSTINDIVDLSKNEDHKTKVSRKEFDLTQLMNSLIHSFEPLGLKKGTQINYSCNDENIICFTDQERLSRAISSTLKFLIREQINNQSISIDLRSNKDNSIDLTILLDQMKDLGDDLIENHPNLSIANKIMLLLGGYFEINTEQAKCNFNFPKRLGINDGESFLIQDGNTELLEQKFLIVEDITSNQKVLQLMLEKLNIPFETASDGQEAIDLCKQNKFSHILMDIHMPKMDGIEATKKIRTFNKGVQIIGISDKAITEFDYQSVGFNDYYVKPIKYTTIEQILA